MKSGLYPVVPLLLLLAPTKSRKIFSLSPPLLSILFLPLGGACALTFAGIKIILSTSWTFQFL